MNRPHHADASLINLGAETMHPDIPVIAHSEDIRAQIGLASMPTIVATGPFNDPFHAEQLAEAFTVVRRRCTAQLVLLGSGRYRSAVMRRALARGVGADVHLRRSFPTRWWSDSVAAADVVAVSSTASEPESLLRILGVGRAVVAPVDPVNVRLVLPTSAGLLYRPGDVSAMATALLRLLNSPTLRHGMACRAAEVAWRHAVPMRLQQPEKGNGYA
jgi:glycosyltransferase involved in cell wall biosynthesis